MLKEILDHLAPFAVIARELTTLRELYEMELASRNPPLIRITESPDVKDTEVYYTGEDEEKRKPSAMLDMLNRVMGRAAEDEEDEV